MTAAALLIGPGNPARAEDLTGVDLQVRQWAEECRKEVTEQMESLLREGTLTPEKLFDTFYIPIPNTDPPQYHTQYNRYTDRLLRPVLDRYLQKSGRLIFVVAVDKNGYLPTHNSKYSVSTTNNVKTNRTKRIFNDPVGRAAASNSIPGFRQIYPRDTGETMWDISSPIYVRGKHWGGFRIGLSISSVEAAKSSLMTRQLGFMFGILVVSFIAAFIAVNRALVPLRRCTLQAAELAEGKMDQSVTSDSKDEIGQLADVLERLRLSLSVAMKKLGQN